MSLKERLENMSRDELKPELEQMDRPHLKEALEIIDRPTLKVALEIIDRPTLKVGLEVIDRPTLKVGLENIDRATLKVGLEVIDRPTMRAAVEVIDDATLFVGLEVVDEPTRDVIGSQVIANFTFDNDITAAQRDTLGERQCAAFLQITACGNLSDPEKRRLIGAYQRAIRHSSITTAGVNGQATIGGSQIWINFGVLFPQGTDEITQTLIHEMMHCAGHRHPRRQPSDTPGDGGNYYNSPPLRAELCIAGRQSDTSCVDEDGRCTIRLPA